LHHAIADTRDLKRSDFPVVFQYFHPAVRLGLVSACYEIFPDRFQKAGYARSFDGPKILAVDARGALVSLGDTVSLLKGLHLRHVHEDPPEAMRLIRLRLSIDASPQLLQIIRCLCHLTPASP
jgi:hypothetical protein